MTRWIKHLLAVGVAACVCVVLRPAVHAGEPVVIGSKTFNESYILAEIFAQLLEAHDIPVRRNAGLGGTLICFEALTGGEIDVYPEYSGTLEQAILKLEDRTPIDRLTALVRERHNVHFLEPLGFNNTYAIALKREFAAEHGLRTIGDLKTLPAIRLAFSHEFNNRKDGWPGLAPAYGLPHSPLGSEHGLAYQALDEGSIDATDVYSTDGDIPRYDLVILEDDKEFFPKYLAAPLVSAQAVEQVRPILNKLAGRIDDDRMQELNADVLVNKASFSEVAQQFLKDEGLVGRDAAVTRVSQWTMLPGRLVRHIELTLIALGAAMAIAIPAGILIYRLPAVSRPVLYVTGALQTIPSIALLAFMIPLFGIGVFPAIVALFLYALLPILRNTATALFSIDPVLTKVGVGMGLTRGEQLRYIELPLALPTILAGVRTAAVISIGTATLAAFIGAGGLGDPIVTGLNLNDTTLILHGAVPATILAISTEVGFEIVERIMIPKHLLATRAT